MQPVQLDAVLKRLRRDEQPGEFDVYAFADYCGAVRDTKVVLAVAIGAGRPVVVRDVRTRSALLEAFHRLLDAASARGLRVLFGQDHQYGIPAPLADELRLPTTDWRRAMRRLFVEGPLAEDAIAGRAGVFAARANALLSRPYFWSATKDYSLPRLPPRPRADPTVRRLTELGFACAFDRIGDNGTVGGQTIVGMPKLLELADRSDVRVWPFDGMRLEDLADHHVAIEPYPTEMREKGVVQSDVNDAIACVRWAQRLDREERRLGERLDLGGMQNRRRIRFEGWIAGTGTPTVARPVRSPDRDA